ncbi:MAG: ubiquitin-like small modifier protein 1 [Halodesulfurarchaeum sp.]|nr:ubiquitin-like small modifier protein 1 [Halodesulfurarchaeum sp.]
MEWKLFADLAETAGEKRVTVDMADGATVAEALEALFGTHPELRDRVLDDGELVSHVNLLVDGEDVSGLEGLDTAVESAAELALFPPVSGG